VHGTATAYNDEMESIAIYRAGLIDVPVTGLKGYYGHTMGAAGIMESILSMYAVQDGTVLATRGYAEQGVTYPVNLSPENRAANGNRFIKLLSGFGGCNAALSYVYLKS
jgi:3-oxoacyl-[acyl-carrier-protein] synthase-1